AVGSGVQEKTGLNNVANDGNAVFHVPVALEIPAGQRGHVAQRMYLEAVQATPATRIVIGKYGVSQVRVLRDERDRGNGANVEAANVAFTAHIKATFAASTFAPFPDRK